MPDRCTDPTCEQHWPVGITYSAALAMLKATPGYDPMTTDCPNCGHDIEVHHDDDTPGCAACGCTNVVISGLGYARGFTTHSDPPLTPDDAPAEESDARLMAALDQLRAEFGDPFTVWGRSGPDAWHSMIGMFTHTGWTPPDE